MEDPLLRRMTRYVQLTDAERALFSELTRARVRLKTGEVLVDEAATSDDLFVLRTGWMFASIHLNDGARQILRIHHPGDLVNTTCLAWSRTAATLTAATPAEATVLPRLALTRIFTEQPRLAALLHGLSTVDNVALSDRLTSLGRTDGRARIATLLLELWSRQRLTDPQTDSSVELFLSQSQIADAVGLTKVHVNRLLKDLTDSGLIVRDGRRVTMPDPEALVNLSGFVDRHADLATDWFPPAP